MEIHYTFFVLYLVLLAYDVDRFQRQLKIIASREKALKIPGVNKPKLWGELDEQRIIHKKLKKRCIYNLIALSALHFFCALLIPLFIKTQVDLPDSHLWYPLPSLALALVILFVNFWLKGSSTGIASGEIGPRGGGMWRY